MKRAILRPQIHHVTVRIVPPSPPRAANAADATSIPTMLVTFEAKYAFHDAALVIHLGAEDAESMLTHLTSSRA